MTEMAQFDRVSFDEYLDASLKDQSAADDETLDALRQEWEAIRLPARSTAGSAGYDFFLPKAMTFRPEANTFFPTGIRCRIDPGWVLILCPKSGLGNKYGMRLTNSLGVVDEDYYFSDNEGHIMVGITTSRKLSLTPGSKYIQGIFLPYGICHGDNVTASRNGGFGSTGG